MGNGEVSPISQRAPALNSGQIHWLTAALWMLAVIRTAPFQSVYTTVKGRSSDEACPALYLQITVRTQRCQEDNTVEEIFGWLLQKK